MKKTFYAVAGICLIAFNAQAQTVVVTGSGSSFSNPGMANASDPSCALALDTWCARNVRNSGSAGITTTDPRSGNGSVEFNGPAGPSYKADFEYYLSPANQFALNDLSLLGYDWFRASTSTTTSHFVPSIRLIMSDLTNLVYEPALNGTPKNTTFAQPTDSWQTTSFGNDGYVWWTAEGTQLAYSLADWKAGRTAANGRSLNGSATVIGFSTGIGSGWSGSFNGAVDNVTYQTSGMNQARTFNFEVASSTVPEPSTYALLAAGLAAIGVVARRRRTA